jgi:hypothetical protein
VAGVRRPNATTMCLPLAASPLAATVVTPGNVNARAEAASHVDELTAHGTGQGRGGAGIARRPSGSGTARSPFRTVLGNDHYDFLPANRCNYHAQRLIGEARIAGLLGGLHLTGGLLVAVTLDLDGDSAVMRWQPRSPRRRRTGGHGIVGLGNRSKRPRARQGTESSTAGIRAADEFGEDLRGCVAEKTRVCREASPVMWWARPA